MITQALIVRYTASVSEKFFPNFWRKTFSAESEIEVHVVSARRIADRLIVLAGYRLSDLLTRLLGN
jgi:hypothetical protein